MGPHADARRVDPHPFVLTWLRAIHEGALEVGDDSGLNRSTRQMAAAGSVLVSAWRLARLRDRRVRTSARILALWDEVDVLLTPRACVDRDPRGGPRRALGRRSAQPGRALHLWTLLFNLTGQPAVTLPAGIGADGLPLSIQLGRPGAEDPLYALAGQLETARPWADRQPPLPALYGSGASAPSPRDDQ